MRMGSEKNIPFMASVSGSQRMVSCRNGLSALSPKKFITLKLQASSLFTWLAGRKPERVPRLPLRCLSWPTLKLMDRWNSQAAEREGWYGCITKRIHWNIDVPSSWRASCCESLSRRNRKCWLKQLARSAMRRNSKQAPLQSQGKQFAGREAY